MIKLYRCSKGWLKAEWEPCWKVEKALIDMGIEYEAVHGPWIRSKRTIVSENTGQTSYPAIEFENGRWYRDDSTRMAATIRAGKLDMKRGQ